MRIAHVSTFPAMKCGIAFYASDLVKALPQAQHETYALHYGKNVTRGATNHANVNNYLSVRTLAQAVSRSAVDIINLQHEFGIWGGLHGEHLLDFLNHVGKPIVSTLHTTFEPAARPAIQTALLRRLVERSSTTFVLSPASRDTLCMALQLPRDAIAVVPHGVPNIHYVPPVPPTGRHPWRFCAIGFFRPNKGIEETLQAFAMLRNEGIPFHFTMVGSPQLQFAGQDTYLSSLQHLVTTLDLTKEVRLRRAFLTRDQQLAVIQSAHAGVFAYQDPDQSSSGTIPLVLASGRPTICTPFEYAKAKARELGNAVWLAQSFDSRAIVQVLKRFISARTAQVQLSKELYRSTRSWLWSEVGRTYQRAFIR